MLNAATIRGKPELKLTQILRREICRIPHHYSVTDTNDQANSHNLKHSTEFTYSDFLCHFKVNSDKPALTFRRGARFRYSIEREKNWARGPYRKKLDRSRARD